MTAGVGHTAATAPVAAAAGHAAVACRAVVDAFAAIGDIAAVAVTHILLGVRGAGDDRRVAVVRAELAELANATAAGPAVDCGVAAVRDDAAHAHRAGLHRRLGLARATADILRSSAAARLTGVSVAHVAAVAVDVAVVDAAAAIRDRATHARARHRHEGLRTTLTDAAAHVACAARLAHAAQRAHVRRKLAVHGIAAVVYEGSTLAHAQHRRIVRRAVHFGRDACAALTDLAIGAAARLRIAVERATTAVWVCAATHSLCLAGRAGTGGNRNVDTGVVLTIPVVATAQLTRAARHTTVVRRAVDRAATAIRYSAALTSADLGRGLLLTRLRIRKVALVGPLQAADLPVRTGLLTVDGAAAAIAVQLTTVVGLALGLRYARLYYAPVAAVSGSVISVATINRAIV